MITTGGQVKHKSHLGEGFFPLFPPVHQTPGSTVCWRSTLVSRPSCPAGATGCPGSEAGCLTLILCQICQILFIQTKNSKCYKVTTCHHCHHTSQSCCSVLSLPRTFKSDPLWCGQLEELLPQSPVLPLFPLDDNEHDHGEDVEHHQEPGTDTDGQVISLSETTTVIRHCGSQTAA